VAPGAGVRPGHVTMPRLYAILDVDVLGGLGRTPAWTPLHVCDAWLSAGVRLIQLRAKSFSSGAFLELADACVSRCRQAGAVCIINDRADIAAMSGADGVHVGQDDLSPTDVRVVAGPNAIVGWSTHDDDQVADATVQPVSYVAIGPVFGTHTKATGYGAVGLAQVTRAAVVVHAAGTPLVAIGGITLERAPQVLAAGADSVAVITDLLVASDLAGVQLRARTWVSAL
jgi:thiamine-phosphate pyrophosphorylase